MAFPGFGLGLCGGKRFAWASAGPGSRGEQFVNPQPEAPGNLLERGQTGVSFDPELVELIELISDAASFRGLFLCPPAGVPQLAQSFAECDRCQFLFHS